MEKCRKLLDECRKCDRFFRRDERYRNCPDCGESRQCRSYPNRGGIYCNEHGGTNYNLRHRGRGMGAPVKTGSQSRSMITKMASKYLEQTKSTPYMMNRKSIDLLDARVMDLLDRTDSESSPERMKRIIGLWQDFKAAVPGLKNFVRADDKATKAFDALEAEMEAAYHDYAAWSQIFEALELRRKHTESEVKILKDMRALMTAEEGMELAAQLFAAIIKVLRDVPHGQDYIFLIKLEFERITGAGDISEVRTGSGEIIDL